MSSYNLGLFGMFHLCSQSDQMKITCRSTIHPLTSLLNIWWISRAQSMAFVQHQRCTGFLLTSQTRDLRTLQSQQQSWIQHITSRRQRSPSHFSSMRHTVTAYCDVLYVHITNQRYLKIILSMSYVSNSSGNCNIYQTHIQVPDLNVFTIIHYYCSFVNL